MQDSSNGAYNGLQASTEMNGAGYQPRQSSASELLEKPNWLAAKLVSKLPERRSNPAAGVDTLTGDLYVFGGQDVKVGLLKTLWRINLGRVINLDQGHPQQFAPVSPAKGTDKWEVVQTSGQIPDPMSHAAGFCSAHKNKFYVFGGTSHRFATKAKGDNDEVNEDNAMMHMLDLDTLEWEGRDSGQKCRDDFAYCFDEQSETLYVFGGFLEGYKSNDLWSYSVKENKWYLLEKGSYSGPDIIGNMTIDIQTLSPTTSPKAAVQKKIEIPAHDGIDRPCQRVGSRMVFNSETLTLYLHGGMDIKNDALDDMWTFSLEKKSWDRVYQQGQTPAARSGHSLVKHDRSIILFGGLLEVTKETEDLYQFDMNSNTWQSHTHQKNEHKTPERSQQAYNTEGRNSLKQGDTQRMNQDEMDDPYSISKHASQRTGSVQPMNRKRSGSQNALEEHQSKHRYSNQPNGAQTSIPGNRRRVNQSHMAQSERNPGRDSVSNTFYGDDQQSRGAKTSMMRYRVHQQRPRAISTLGPIPSVYSIPTLREAKALKEKEYDAMAKTVASGKFSMLTQMAAEDQKKKDALALHKASFNKGKRPHTSVLAMQMRGSSKQADTKTEAPKSSGLGMLKGLKQKLLVMGEKKAQKVARLRAMAAESPTSLRMKTSFIMKNQNKSFDEYFAAMKRRNAQKGLTTTHNGLVYKNNGQLHHAHTTPTEPVSPQNRDGRDLRKQQTFIARDAKRVTASMRASSVTEEGPKPRDGHVAMNLGNNMFVFGGDRHQVPFNDLFFLPLGEL